ncbi:MAG: hypothetical protein ACLUTA_15100 [Blautia wexlerae]
MEIVPDKYIQDIRTTPDYDKKDPHESSYRFCARPECNHLQIYPPVFLESEGLTDDLLHEEITSAALLPGKESAIPIPESAQKSWTPEEPWLYPYSLEYGEDRVLGYFALRKCNVRRQLTAIPLLPQRPALFPERRAGSGLLAGWTLYCTL